jgi:hypothetical protein
MAPGEDLVSDLRAQEVFRYQNTEHLVGEDAGQGGVTEDGDRLEGAVTGKTPLGNEHMEVRVEVEAVPEGLDYRYHPRHEVSLGTRLHILPQGSYRREA